MTKESDLSHQQRENLVRTVVRNHRALVNLFPEYLTQWFGKDFDQWHDTVRPSRVMIRQSWGIAELVGISYSPSPESAAQQTFMSIGRRDLMPDGSYVTTLVNNGISRDKFNTVAGMVDDILVKIENGELPNMDPVKLK